MNFRWIAKVHVRGLAQRWTRTLLSVIAVGAGVSLVVGVVISKHSLDRSLDNFTGELSGSAALRVEGAADHGGLDASVAPRVAAVPGVQAVVPMVITITQVADSRGRELLVPALGVDCSIQALVGAFQCSPELMQRLGDNPVVSPRLQKRLGPSGELRTDLQAFPTAPALAVGGLNRINAGLVVLFELSASQRQFVRPGGLDELLVVAKPHTKLKNLRAAVAAAAGRTNRVVAGDAPIGSSLVASLLLPFLFLISLIGLVIGAQLVRNTLELSLEERRRELATTAALGATPHDVLAGLLVEGVIIGAIGGVLAIAGGALVARAFVGSLSAQLAKATGLHIPVSTPPSALVVCAVMGIGVAVLASIAPARRAAKLDLVAELSERTKFEVARKRSNRSLAITGTFAVVMLGLGWAGHRNGALKAWQPPALILALAASAIVGYAACAQITPRLLAALQRAPGFKTGPTRVALGNIVAAPRRTVAVTIAITAPVFVSVVLSGIVPGMRAGAETFAHAVNDGRVWVSTLDTNNTSGIDAKVTPAIEERLAALPGVASLAHSNFVSFEDSSGMFAIDGTEGPAPTFHVYRGLSGQEAFDQGKVMIGPALARRHHSEPGDSITVPGRYGPVSFTVGGIWSSPESLGYSINMSIVQLRTVVGPRPPDYVQLIPTPGVTTAALAQTVRAAHLDPRLKVFAPEQLGVELARDFGEIAQPFKALQAALVVVALIATASTLLLAAAQRRRENAVLAALGMAPRDLAFATLIETGIIAFVATTVAAVTSQLTLLCFTWASEVLSGMVIPYRLDVRPVLIAAVVVTLIAVVGATLPAWRTARTNVMTALRTA